MKRLQAKEGYTSRTEGSRTRTLVHDLANFPEVNNGTVIKGIEVAASGSTLQLKAVTKAFETAPEMLPPYVVEVEVNCEECGGSGFDPGGIDPWGPEVCQKCHGAKTQTVVRNYLAEAFQIAANPDSMRPIERQHLVAVIQHCREVVSALVSLPEVA